MQIADLIEKFRHTRDGQGRAIFSTIFIAGNRLQTSFDRADGQVTLKQFMLLTMLRQSGEDMTFTQLGELLGCSRQNIKKLAASWRRRGWSPSPGIPLTGGPASSVPQRSCQPTSGRQRSYTPKSWGTFFLSTQTKRWSSFSGSS